MNIEQEKNELVETLHSLDKEKLSLSDLRLYAEILKILSEIQEKSYFELLTETLKSGGGLGARPITVSDLK